MGRINFLSNIYYFSRFQRNFFLIQGTMKRHAARTIKAGTLIRPQICILAVVNSLNSGIDESFLPVPDIISPPSLLFEGRLITS